MATVDPIPNNIKKFRLQRGLTQEKLAELCDNRSVNQLNAYERGRSKPSPRLLAIIARALGVSVSDLTQSARVAVAPGNVAALLDSLRNQVASDLGVLPSAVRVSIEISNA